MPWKTVTAMSLRQELVVLAQTNEISFSHLCDRYGISRKTGYKWLSRYQQEGLTGLANRSRRPHHIARHIEPEMEEAIVALRRHHPTWGSRKIRRKLLDAQAHSIPSCSTITAVLHRNNLINPETPAGRRDWRCFEHTFPNALWQMDFKAPVKAIEGIWHPLTVLDDYSRFSLCLNALHNQHSTSVYSSLSSVFCRYGLPDSLLVDNGSPWGSDATHPWTPLTVWMTHLGIKVIHSRPYHPQTLGKEERFHRTLKRDLLSSCQWQNKEHLQKALDAWRHEYNFERPHDSLGLEVPASRYKPSLRPFPKELPSIEYPQYAHVRKVQQGGEFSFKGREFRVSKAFVGNPIGIIPTSTDGVFKVLFSQQHIANINLINTS
jgi:transposase InsO family protein